MTKPARILIVAGSDSGGGAGIQADIKTVTMLGGFATTAITAITAQNTRGVAAVMPVPAAMVLAQIDAVWNDIGVDAIKIGMLGSAELAFKLGDWLGLMRSLASARGGRFPAVVFDPVMVATSGATLADADTIAGFAKIMAHSDLVTPNLPELAVLGGEEAVRTATRALLVKGGHGGGDTITDRLIAADGDVTQWTEPRIATTSTHGTGCTLASAIACGLGEGLAMRDAVARARTFVRLALREAPGFGSGAGPMGHQAVRLDVGGGARLNQLAVGVDDYAGGVAFYRALGLKLIVDAPPDYARFEAAGGATLSLHRGGGGLYLEHDDLDGAIASARAAGVAVGDPVDQPWGWREAWTTDPTGTRVCLYHAGELRRFPPWRVA